MATKETSTALAVIDTSEWLLATYPENELAELLQDILGTSQLNTADLIRVKVPSSGATTWEIPDPDAEGGVRSTRSFEGVVLEWTEPWTYWEKSLADGAPSSNTPPDCYSLDGKVGHGTPGGDCLSCPMRCEFPAKCSPKRMLFILQPDNMLPIVLQVPRMSIKVIRQYFAALGSKGKHFRAHVTKFTLEATKNSNNQPYSVIKVENVGPVEEAMRGQLWAYAKNLKPMITGIALGNVENDGPDEAAATTG